MKMNKIGILTFHYSNNYGGVLQTVALYNTIKSLGYDVEVINYIPKGYKKQNIIRLLGINKKNIKNSFKIFEYIKKILIIMKYKSLITRRFDTYRKNNLKMSRQVDEDSLENILSNYSTIVVGSDQVWNPSQRKDPFYFLNFGTKYKGKKISYAPDSTVSEISKEDFETVKNALNQFEYISVRNRHTYDFVYTAIKKDTEIVVDPTLLYDFNNNDKKPSKEEYILTYILGKEINGSHTEVISKIKNKYGDLPVYSIKIPSANFDFAPFSSKVFYDLSPSEWISMFQNAKFIYTDSFHGVLFSMKYRKPFLAYYTEALRSTRFIDLGNRYGIDNFIVKNTTEIEKKCSLDLLPDYKSINQIINQQKNVSIEFLKSALKN